MCMSETCPLQNTHEQKAALAAHDSLGVVPRYPNDSLGVVPRYPNRGKVAAAIFRHR